MIHLDRLEAANKALKLFPIGKLFQFEIVTTPFKDDRVPAKRLAVWYSDYWNKGTREEPKKVSKIWVFQCSGSHYPSFSLPTGGTMTNFLANLVLWIKGKPTMPLTVFEFWGTPNYGLFRDSEKGDHTTEVVKILEEAGYPREVKCVVCKQKPKGLDWWSDDKKAGPCCSYGRCDVVPQLQQEVVAS